MEKAIKEMHKAIDVCLAPKYVEDLDYAKDRLGMSIDVLRRACRAGKLNFAVALPPENDNIKWRYLLDIQAFEQCLSGERDLFK